MLLYLYTTMVITIFMHIVDQTYQSCVNDESFFIGASLERESHQILSVSPIAVFKVPPFAESNCIKKCCNDSRCESFNLKKPPDSEGLQQCQLLATDKYNHSTRLEPATQYHHYSSTCKSRCSSSPCRNNGTCVTSLRNDSYTCQCPHDVGGFNCEKRWEKQSPTQVCFGSRGNSFGPFNVTRKGRIRTFRFVHVSGNVSCYAPNPNFASPWGCRTTPKPDENIELVVTHENNSKIFPAGATSYYLPGVTNKDPVLELPEFSPLLEVTKGQELRMWFAEDLLDGSEHDNPPGTSCSYVYARFADT